MNSISTRRRLVAILLLPFVLMLAGCGKLHATFDVQDAETVNVSYDLAIDTEYAESSYSSAQEMCDDLLSDNSLGGDMAPSIEPYEEGGQYGCRVVGAMTSDNFDSTFNITEEDGELHVVIDGGADAESFSDPEVQSLGIDFQMTFTFPGKVIESSGGEIDGNSVVFTDLNDVANGIDIRADAGGFPWIIVIVIVLVLGFLLLLVIAAIIFFVLRARKKKNAVSGGTSGTPSAYGASAAAGVGAGAASVPAAPQGQQGQPGAQPQGGQLWGSQGSPPAAPQPQAGQPWGSQASPPPAAPQWGQASPPAAPQNDPQWGSQPQQGQQPQQGGQPWEQQPGQQPGGQQDSGRQPWDRPEDGQQPPQNPGW